MSRIGKMQERVGIVEIQQGQPDGIGGYTTTKSTVATVWARVETLAGARGYEQQSVYNRNPYRVTMRAGTYDVTANNLLEWNGVELTITSVTKDEDNRFTIVDCNG